MMAICHRVKHDICHATEVHPRGHDGGMSRTPRPSSYSEVQRQVGQRLLWARELVEPNRAAFARSLGLDRSTVQKIEEGDRPPSIFNVLEFSHALRVTPDYLLTGSMRGIDGELAARLAAAHPELGRPPPTPSPGIPDRAIDSDSGQQPRKRRPRAA